MRDTIYRQDVIDTLERICFSHWFKCREYDRDDVREYKIISKNKALEEIEALPSAQPEIIRCKDCVYWDIPGYCLNFMTQDENGFCSWAERAINE